MISVTLVPNVFEPARREFVTCTGVRSLRSLVPDTWDPSGRVVYIVNGRAYFDDRCVVTDGDQVTVAGGVDGPETWLIVLAVISLIAAAVTYAKLQDLEDQLDNPDDSATYGYYGLRNNYRAEGDAIPVVYGFMRVAGPCINQAIVGDQPGFNSPAATDYAKREVYIASYLIGHGPIEGIGRYVGPCLNEADQREIEEEYGLSPLEGTGLLVNKIAASSYDATIKWRTGTNDQSAISEFTGPSRTSDIAATYEFNLKPENGVPTGTLNGFSSGLVNYADRIIYDDATEYVSHRIDKLSTRAVIQFDYAVMYNQNSENGNFSSISQAYRYQYWETDASGNRTSDVFVSSPANLTANTLSPISFDRYISFFDPATFNPGNAGGHALAYPTGSTHPTPSTTYDFNYPILVGASGAGACIGQTDGSGQGASFTYMGWYGVIAYSTELVMFSWSDSSIVGGVPVGGLTGEGYSGATRGTAAALKRLFDGTVWFYFQVLGDSTCEDSTVTQSRTIWRGKLADSYEELELYAGGAFATPNSWTHLSVTYDGSYYSEAAGTPAKLRACINGSIFANLEIFQNFVREDGPLHCAPQHPTSTGLGAARITIGQGFHNNNFSKHVLVSDFVMLGRALNESTIVEYGNPALYTFQHPQVANYPVKAKGARDFRLDPYCWIALSFASRQLNAVGKYMTRNHASNPGGALSFTEGDFSVDGGGLLSYAPFWDAPGSGGAQEGGGAPVAYGAQADPKRAYWQVEIFLGTQKNEAYNKSDGTISNLVAFDLQPYSYPGLAHYLVEIAGNDAIANKTPQSSILVRGRKAVKWDGTYILDKPALSYEWTRNPAWVAADLLTNSEFGLGGEIGTDRVDWDSFREWASYCEEGVPDGFGEYRVTGIKIESSTGPFERDITLKVPLVGPPPTYTGVQVLPKEWQPLDAAVMQEGSTLTIMEANNIDSEFVTKDDKVGGLNDADSKLALISIDINYDSTGTLYGVYSWAEVRLRWNRYDENGDAVFPGLWGTSIGGFDLSEDQTTDYIFKIAGFEPRALFDGTFDQAQKSGWDAVLQVFRTGRAQPILSGTKVYAQIDRPRPPVTLFTQGNVVANTLTLRYRNPSEMPNSIEGEILDRYDNFEKATVQVDHPSTASGAENDAFRKERLAFTGVTRRSQAMRDGRYLLNRYHYIRREISFVAGPDALFVFPGDRIRFAHDTPRYGVSGRLRSGSTSTSNLYPGAGANYSDSFTDRGGSVSLTTHHFFADRSSTLPTAYLGNAQSPVWLKSAPLTANRLPLITQANAEDLGYEVGPKWYQQVIANSTVLYPPNAPTETLDQVVSSDYTGTFSVFCKEPSDGASDEVTLALYRLVDEDGVLIDAAYKANFRWLGGNLIFHSVSPSSGGVTGAVTSVGNGWFRASVSVDNTLLATPFEIGDYIQARLYHGRANAGTFDTVARGGKGINFLYRGDPLWYANGLGAWRAFNTATIGTSITNKPASITNAPPPLYAEAISNGEVVDASFGYMVLMAQSGSTAPITNPLIFRQEFELPTGSGVSTWNGENIHLTIYARVSPTNTNTGTTMHIDLRGVDSASTLSYNIRNQPSDDGIRVNLSTSAGGGSWAISSSSRTTTGGSSVNSPIASVSPVRLNSTTTDPDWVEIDITLNMTPPSGDLQKMVLSIECDGPASVGTKKDLLIWNCRVHGDASGGTVTYYPYAHQGLLAWGPMYSRTDAVTDYETGSTLLLDREITTEAGKSYEIYVRSSSQPDLANSIDNTAVVYLDSQHIPATGSQTIAANTALSCSEISSGFLPEEGDVFSFGEVGSSVRDYVVTSTTLDPTQLTTEIEAEEYRPEVYESDFDYTDIGLPPVSRLVDPQDADSRGAATGAGYFIGRDGSYPDMRISATALKDPEGGEFTRISVSWRMPKFGEQPRAWRWYLYIPGEQKVRQVGETPCGDELFVYDSREFTRDASVSIYCAAVGTDGSASDWTRSRKLNTKVQTTAGPARLPIAQVTTTIRGLEQVYTLSRFSGSRTYDVIEGRVGSWFFGHRAFLIDPGVGNVVSDVILTAPTNAAGEAQLPIVVRPRSRSGIYGQQTEVLGTENIEDVDFTYAYAHEDNYTSGTAYPVDLQVSGGYIEFAPSSTALTATFTIDAIDLGEAYWFIPSVGMRGQQIRPETLADFDFKFSSDAASRWTFEGPTDDLDGDNMTAAIEWRWSTGLSITGSTWRTYEPGRVYARHVQYRVTFTRPTTSYNMKVTRLVTQALRIPESVIRDVDGGVY